MWDLLCDRQLVGFSPVQDEFVPGGWPPEHFRWFSTNKKFIIGVMWPASFPQVGSTAYYVTWSLLKVDQPNWFPQSTSVY